jgi:predicted RNA binding protein YcfA (HicA-like mRNA interferase family)
MAKELRPLAPTKIIKALSKLGFKPVRQRGSHLVLQHSDGRMTVVVMHGNEEIGRGLLLKIIKDGKVSKEEFLDILDEI